MEWIVHLGGKCTRINAEDALALKYANEDSFGFQIEGETIDFEEITAYWYRRGDLNFYNTSKQLEGGAADFLIRRLVKFTELEQHALKSYFHYLLNRTSSIGAIWYSNTNKMIVLAKAKEVGLCVPPTLITTEKNQVKKFLEKHKHIVTKTISNMLGISDHSMGISSYTEELTAALIHKLPEEFLPGLFQKKIEKKYEIRSFYIKGTFYSMAIFSQLDEQTSTDFRHYNKEKPNRNVPFQLPKEIEQKLTLLMNALGYNTGSFDLIVTPENEFVFLEVNPIGQFGMTSYPCNYYLEKELAHALLHPN
jgi:ATP-GRASP peptide maturase of grasp-with-spasm system